MRIFDRSIIKVPANIVLWACKNERLDELAMFLLFKRVYRSGEYHSMSVPMELGISRPTFRKYVKKFIESGWAETSNVGFRLTSIFSLQKHIYQFDSKYCFHKIITLKNLRNKSTLKTQLRWIVIQDKFDQIQYAQSCTDLSINYSERRSLPKTLRKLVMAKAGNVEMGTTTIGKSFGRTKATGERVKKKLKELKMLSYKHQGKIVFRKNVSLEGWASFQCSSTYSHGYFTYFKNGSYKEGVIYEYKPDIIKLNNPLSSIALNKIVPTFFQ